MKKIVVSCGPIPAKLDSVKFVTNRFKGGLAFKTAAYLHDKGHDVTVVMWKHTPLPDINGEPASEYWARDGFHIVAVEDVTEYYRWFQENAHNYEGFILAAAVANLMPVTPWEGKFPSHQYKPGEKFDIKFQIAPRAIDIIKEINLRAALIGYKLFDCDSDEELVEIARETRAASHADIIFANRPNTASTEKLAVMPDGAVIHCSFDEHLELISRCLNQVHFRTESEWEDEDFWNAINVREAVATVKMFEPTFPQYGTVAVPVAGTDWFATTSRGHSGEPVIVKSVDSENGIVRVVGKEAKHQNVGAGHYANSSTIRRPCSKATLNAPALYAMLGGVTDSIVVHRHDDDPLFRNGRIDVKFDKYLFPGTLEEYQSIRKTVLNDPDQCKRIKLAYHGDLSLRPIKKVNWHKYEEQFPSRYFGIPDEMAAVLDKFDENDILDIGCGVRSYGHYTYDPNVAVPKAMNLSRDQISGCNFGLAVACNSINYLSEGEIRTILDHSEHFIANTFLKAPMVNVRKDECAVLDTKTFTPIMRHTLRLMDDSIVRHTFHAYTRKDYEDMGLTVTATHGNSAIVSKGLGFEAAK